MRCPSCVAPTTVVDSGATDDGRGIRRRRRCSGCELLFVTTERFQVVAIQRCGVFEPFSRQSVIARVRTAAKRQTQIADASAGRARSGKPPLCASLAWHLPGDPRTESSKDGCKSPFSLVSASGRG